MENLLGFESFLWFRHCRSGIFFELVGNFFCGVFFVGILYGPVESPKAKDILESRFWFAPERLPRMFQIVLTA